VPVQIVARAVVPPRRTRVGVPGGILHIAQTCSRVQARRDEGMPQVGWGVALASSHQEPLSLTQVVPVQSQVSWYVCEVLPFPNLMPPYKSN
jgi:hypothetical protein